MRFIYLDRVLELEPDKRALGNKLVTISEEFFPTHYEKVPVVPPTILIECMAQLGGWLHIVSRDFQIETVLVLVEGAEFLGSVRPGDLLTVEAWLTFGHIDGATVRAEVRIGEQLIARVGRMLFGSKVIPDPTKVQGRRDAFAYRGGTLNGPRRS